MTRFFYIWGIVFLSLSCKNSSTYAKKQLIQNLNDSGENNSIKSNYFKPHLNPTPGSQYYYTISNEYNIEVEANGKKTNSLSKSEVGVTYNVQKDSAGNLLLHIRYDKIHLHTKSGDNETDMDADNAGSTFNPVEKMLGLLKTANVVATINPAGKIVAINGYKELGEKIIAGLNTTDAAAKSMAQSQWDKVIGEGLVKRNIDELFNVFPDSSIHIGDTWKMNTQQKGQINLNVSSDYKLKDIDDGVAIIESEGELASDKGQVDVMGTLVSGNLQGNQQGEYEVDTQTGMMLKNKVTAKVEGSLQMAGKDIPVTIKTTVTMNGKKLN
jgi:hypothetical protein